MIMKVRLGAMLKHKKSLYPNAKNVKSRYNLANKYFKFLRLKVLFQFNWMSKQVKKILKTLFTKHTNQYTVYLIIIFKS